MPALRFEIYKAGTSSGRYTALRTLRLSATGPRSVQSIISSSVGGAGSSRRILNWYAQQKKSAAQMYKAYYPDGVVVL